MIAADTTGWVGLFTGPFALLLFLLALIWTGVKRMWVFGWQFEDMKADRDRYRSIAERGVGAAEDSVAVTAEVAKRSREHEEAVMAVVDEAKRRGLLS